MFRLIWVFFKKAFTEVGWILEYCTEEFLCWIFLKFLVTWEVKWGLAGEVTEDKDCTEQEIMPNFAQYSPEQEERQYAIWVIAYLIIIL